MYASQLWCSICFKKSDAFITNNANYSLFKTNILHSAYFEIYDFHQQFFFYSPLGTIYLKTQMIEFKALWFYSSLTLVNWNVVSTNNQLSYHFHMFFPVTLSAFYITLSDDIHRDEDGSSELDRPSR
jgi:hypothetical protein